MLYIILISYIIYETAFIKMDECNMFLFWNTIWLTWKVPKIISNNLIICYKMFLCVEKWITSFYLHKSGFRTQEKMKSIAWWFTTFHHNKFVCEHLYENIFFKSFVCKINNWCLDYCIFIVLISVIPYNQVPIGLCSFSGVYI